MKTLILLLLFPLQALAAWEYVDQADPMGRGAVKVARVMSSNTVDFRRPYDSGQKARLSVRRHPQHGLDAIIGFRSAQFLCSGIDRCTVLVRFDDGKPVTYPATTPADHSRDALFILNSDRFVRELLKAKRVLIEAQFYQDGARVLEFDVAGLEWAMPGQKPAAKPAAVKSEPVLPGDAAAKKLETSMARARKCREEAPALVGDELKSFLLQCVRKQRE